MNIDLKKTTAQIDRCLPDSGEANLIQLHRMYDLTLRLQSQLLSVIYDIETFGDSSARGSLAWERSRGVNDGSSVTLTIHEPLPSMKKLTEAIEEHWKAMLHAAIDEAARQAPFPYFGKVMVELEIVTPRGSDNARLWDTSNRAINVFSTVQAQYEELKAAMKKDERELPKDFAHPLDEEIIGKDGEFAKLLSEQENAISYSKAGKLDNLWRSLLNKSIVCLRYFDTREPFLDNPNKAIVAYGIDKLEEYHRRYTEFEGLMYGSSAYYRDHVFHAVRVWMLGVFCLLKNFNGQEMFIKELSLDGGAKTPEKIGFFEYISMWTIIALCHDLGYPLEKAEQVLDKTRKMMREFVPSPNVWNNFGYSGTQDNINEYVLKFISTKMKEKTLAGKTVEPEKAGGQAVEETAEPEEIEYLGRIQPKYYLKYAKSLEGFQHGIISTIIIYKMLLYFLESDFNLNDDYI